MMEAYMTPEIEKLINEAIFLPAMRMALEHDKKILEQSDIKLKFKAQHLKLIDDAHSKITETLRENKQKMSDHSMKIYQRKWFDCDVRIKGIHQHYFYQRETAGAWIFKNVAKYFKG
jgi:hypothetical protein